jgi:hypothetical protein
MAARGKNETHVLSDQILRTVGRFLRHNVIFTRRKQIERHFDLGQIDPHAALRRLFELLDDRASKRIASPFVSGGAAASVSMTGNIAPSKRAAAVACAVSSARQNCPRRTRA